MPSVRTRHKETLKRLNEYSVKQEVALKLTSDSDTLGSFVSPVDNLKKESVNK